LTRVSKSYFNKKLRVGKLDSALLFLSSTVGLMFAVIRAAINPSTSIVTSIPLIVLGIVLPFYYGYVRGALVKSSAVDRYRGWIFFLVGLGAYGYDIVVEWMNQVLPLAVGRLSYLTDVPVGVLGVLSGYFVARRFHRFIFQVLGEPPSRLISLAAVYTVLSALFFAAVGSNVATINDLGLYTGGALTLLLFGGVYYLRVSERYAGYANSRAQYSVQLVKGKWYGKGLPSWTGLAIYALGLIFFLAGTLYFVTTATTVSDVAAFFLELVAAIVLILTGGLVSKLVGRREVLSIPPKS
jgi:hypothetical protein